MSKITFIVTCLLLLMTVNSNAGQLEQEINHLLGFVEATSCQLERNGRRYSGQKAAEHIRKKYKYFSAHIDTAEKFIELSATKSTLSDKPYLVICKGMADMSSKEWLQKELLRYRAE